MEEEESRKRKREESYKGLPILVPDIDVPKVGKSKVWRHFTKETSGGDVTGVCTFLKKSGDVCGQVIKVVGGSTSGMIKHAATHGILISVPQKKGKKSQVSIKESFPQGFEGRCDFSVEKYIAGTGKAPNTVAHPLFVDLLNTLSSGKYKPKTPQTVMANLTLHARVLDGEKKNRIPPLGKENFSISFDEWTGDIHQLEYLGSNIVFINEDWRFVVVKTGVKVIERANANSLGPKLLELLGQYGLDVANVACVCGDGAPVVQATVRDHLNDVPFVWCIPHWMSVAIKKSLHFSRLFMEKEFVVKSVGNQLLFVSDPTEAKVVINKKKAKQPFPGYQFFPASNVNSSSVITKARTLGDKVRNSNIINSEYQKVKAIEEDVRHRKKNSVGEEGDHPQHQAFLSNLMGWFGDVAVVCCVQQVSTARSGD